ncbi:MAG: 4Fe-4S binding protein [Eggerthellaceae bacterium]|nr:4Fe-4S binding protein [Eggerthellaceae bacterium]
MDTNDETIRPEAKVVILRDFCVRSKGADCNRCESACPKAAISFSDEGLPVIDAQSCSVCGICYGICDSFSSNRVTMLDLHARVKRIAARGDKAFFTCKENIFPGFEVSGNVIVLPCLACLSPEFWTLLLSENILVRVACDIRYCADCERAGSIAEDLYSHAIATAEKWTGNKVGFSEEIPEKKALINELANPNDVDRRSMFTNIFEDVGDIATGKRRIRESGVLQRFAERRERSKVLAALSFAETDILNADLSLGRNRKIMTPKRQMLLEAILANPEIAKNIPVFIASIDHDRCQTHKACLSACPTGALSLDPETEKLRHDARYCIACGICVDICPNAAMSIVERTATCF